MEKSTFIIGSTNHEAAWGCMSLIHEAACREFKQTRILYTRVVGPCHFPITNNKAGMEGRHADDNPYFLNELDNEIID